MKTSIKTFVATALIATMCVTPVVAAPTTADVLNNLTNHNNTVITQLGSYLKTADGCGEAAAADHALHAGVVAYQVLCYDNATAQNHVNYLRQVVVNAKETERIKKEIVDNYTNLAKVNPQFANLIPQATVDYNNAVLARQAAEAAIAEAIVMFTAEGLTVN